MFWVLMYEDGEFYHQTSHHQLNSKTTSIMNAASWSTREKANSWAEFLRNIKYEKHVLKPMKVTFTLSEE